MTRKKTSPVPVEERVRVVLSVLSGQMTMAEAARRHGVADATVAKWRDRFVEAGKASLADGTPGPGTAQAIAERRLRAENEQLKLALAEQMVQLRIWQREPSTLVRSLRRPRSPKERRRDAGFEVRCVGRYP